MKFKDSRITLLNLLAVLGRVPHSANAMTFTVNEGSASIARKGSDCELSMRLAETAVINHGSCAVDFQQFKSTLERMDAVMVTVEQDKQMLIVTGDTGHAETLSIIAESAKFTDVPHDADSTLLPTGFYGFLHQTFQATSSDPTRPVLGGVNISARGIAATDGHQLVHIPCPLLTLKGNVTIHDSPLFSHLNKFRWTSLAVWNPVPDETWYCIEGAGFKLVSPALQGTFPKYWQAMPDESELDITATINSKDVRERIIDFLKTATTDKEATVEMWFYQNRIEIKDMADRTSFITADVTGTSLPHGIRCKIEFLRHALKVGHTTLSHDVAGVCPIVASGGAGLYLWMPVKPSPASPPQHNKPNESAAQPDAAQLPCKPKQLSTKEKQPMQTPSTPFHQLQTPSTPFHQPASPITPPSASPIPTATTDPLQELMNLVATMKTQLDDLQNKHLDISRKLREATQSARQKERIYQETSRKLERIRMAV